MSLTRQYYVNPEKARSGVPFPVGRPDKNGKRPTFVLARASSSNANYQATLDRYMAPHRAAMRGRAMPQELFAELTRRAFAEAGILGWTNVLADDVYGEGKRPTGYVPGSDDYEAYSPEAAYALLTRLPELYDLLAEVSTGRELFGDEEADAGNS
jgi:hypothetical protein